MDAGPLKANIPDTLTMLPSPLATMPGTGARISIVGCDHLHVNQFVGFVCRQIDKRHGVRNAGVVDEHG
jgi:hypothetical protein